jgi:hypothetical protein
MNAPIELTPEQRAPEIDTNLIGDIAALFAALADAQGEFPPIEKNRTGEVKKDGRLIYTFDYADMGEIRAKTTPSLTKFGLGITSIPAMADPRRGGYILRTILFHKSGARIESALHISEQAKVTDFGGYVTFLRRYQVSAMLNIAADSDLDDSKRDPDGGDDGTPRIGQGSTGRAPGNPPEHPLLTQAGSVGELNKAWLQFSTENKTRYQAHYDRRMDELDPPTGQNPTPTASTPGVATGTRGGTTKAANAAAATAEKKGDDL